MSEITSGSAEGERASTSWALGAVWRVSRAAVKRRRLQTIAIGLVVLVATTTVFITLAVLNAASGSFETAFAQQRGAHAVVTFDASKVTGEELARTAERPGVEAAAGPYPQAVLQVTKDWHGESAGPLTVVGRAGPGGAVDRVELRVGRWATAPGEVVINFPAQGNPGPHLLGGTIEAEGVPPLTVVGFATSMSQSAGAWVTPEQMAALHSIRTQMLYRFTAADTDQQVSAGLAEVTAGLPREAQTAVQSYLTLKRAFSYKADSYVPLLAVFGVLGLVVSVLIVGNVVSGAVVSAFRRIGVLKAIGFTPNQVVAVYLTMVSVPAIVCSVIGTVIGSMVAQPILAVAFSGVEAGSAIIGVAPWVPVVCLLGMPALVALAGLVPALRARRLPAARAIAAGSAPRTGRGLRAQRWLAGTRLPRPVSLGLGLSFTRPGRTGLTTAAVALGVTAVTLAVGVSSTMIAAGNLGRTDGALIKVQVGGRPETNRPAPELRDADIAARLRAIPGAEHVTARAFIQVQIAGFTQTRFANFYRGDNPPAPLSQTVAGRWVDGPDEVVAGPTFLAQHGLAVGDRITLRAGGRESPVTVVGELGDSHPRAVTANWQALARLAPDTQPAEYYVELFPDADAQSYMDEVKDLDPGLLPSRVEAGSFATTAVVSISTVFTVLLSIVAALGVFNTVLLGVRERRRDLGLLKSIGLTPRQVTTMTVTSVAAPGALGGLLGIPIGILTHRLFVDNVTAVVFPEYMKDVWDPLLLAALATAGLVIAVLGALIPARSAARLTIAQTLHNE